MSVSGPPINHKIAHGHWAWQATKASQTDGVVRFAQGCAARPMARIVRLPKPEKMTLSAVTGFKRLALAVGALILGVFGALAVVSCPDPEGSGSRGREGRDSGRNRPRSAAARGRLSLAIPLWPGHADGCRARRRPGRAPAAGRPACGAPQFPAAADRASIDIADITLGRSADFGDSRRPRPLELGQAPVLAGPLCRRPTRRRFPKSASMAAR